MVNKVVLEYLRLHRGNFKINDLKKKVLASGYSQKDIDEAVAVLTKEGAKKVPDVGATIDKINKTNIDVNAHKPVVNKPVQKNVQKDVVVKPVDEKAIASAPSPSKKMKILKWLLIGFMIIFILGVIGFSVWMFFLK